MPEGEGGGARAEAHPPAPTKLDRAASAFRSLGFVWDALSRGFRRGTDVIRETDGLFEWEWYDGNRTRPLWIAATGLDDANGVELPVEIWQVGVARDGLLLESHGDGVGWQSFSDLASGVRAGRYGQTPSRFRIWRESD